MRARNIKPGFYRDADLAECSIAARYIAPGLWMIADREGRMKDNPKQIKMELCPCDDLDIDGLLDELQRAGHLLRYEVSGRRYIQILKFTKHQNPHKNEASEGFPVPPEITGVVEKLPEQSSSPPSNPADSLNPDILIPELKSSASGSADAVDSGQNFYLTKRGKKLTGKRLETFNRFWETFDYKKGKAEAAQAWYDIPSLTDSLVQKILTAAEIEAMNRDEVLAAGKTPKMAQGWLTGRRWEDEGYQVENLSSLQQWGLEQKRKRKEQKEHGHGSVEDFFGAPL